MHEGKDRSKGLDNLSNEIVKDFPNLETELEITVNEPHRIFNRLEQKRSYHNSHSNLKSKI